MSVRSEYVYADDGWVEFSVGEAVAYGWHRVWANAGFWLVLMLGGALVLFGFEFALSGFHLDGIGDLAWSGSYAVPAIGGLLLSAFLQWLLGGVLLRAALQETRGRPAQWRALLTPVDVSAVLAVCAVLAIGTTVGRLLFVLPAIVFCFLTAYALAYVLDDGHDAVTALRSSVQLVAANVGRLLMLAGALIGLNVAGAAFCGIGLLVTIPVSAIAASYAFRVLHGERVT